MNSQYVLDAEGHEAERSGLTGKRLLAIGGVLGALAASSCCVVPLVLISLGVGGAWMGNLTALAPYNAYFVAFTVACLGVGFYLVYRKPKVVCAADAACGTPVSNRLVKSALWGATILLAVAVAFRYVAPLLLGIS